jgi:hypothetical protein
VARDLKVFLSLQSGVTRGPVPDARLYEERAQGAPEGRPAAEAAGGAAAGAQTGALPDFVVIGAAKCGTTSFYDLLSRHPYVEPALEKELNYFTKNFDKGIEWYSSQLPPHRWHGGRRFITKAYRTRYPAGLRM